jgi:hypothetical protein
MSGSCESVGGWPMTMSPERARVTCAAHAPPSTLRAAYMAHAFECGGGGGVAPRDRASASHQV